MAATMFVRFYFVVAFLSLGVMSAGMFKDNGTDLVNKYSVKFKPDQPISFCTNASPTYGNCARRAFKLRCNNDDGHTPGKFHLVDRKEFFSTKYPFPRNKSYPRGVKNVSYTLNSTNLILCMTVTLNASFDENILELLPYCADGNFNNETARQITFFLDENTVNMSASISTSLVSTTAHTTENTVNMSASISTSLVSTTAHTTENTVNMSASISTSLVSTTAHATTGFINSLTPSFYESTGRGMRVEVVVLIVIGVVGFCIFVCSLIWCICKYYKYNKERRPSNDIELHPMV